MARSQGCVINCLQMNFIRMLIAALVGLLSTSLLVSALEPINEQNKSEETAQKQYIVTLRDEISGTDFDEVSNWITGNGGKIVESINENFAKLIIAKADESISNF